MAVPLLVRGQLRTRWRRYLLVALNSGFGFFGFFVVVMVTVGAQAALVEPIGAVFSGDVRVTQGSSRIPAEEPPSDLRAVAARFDREPGVEASQRIEASYITVRTEDLDLWSAGLLLGVEPGHEAERDAIGRYLVWGTAVEAIDVVDPDTGRAYAPLVVGAPTAERLNLTLGDDGPAFNETLTLTSGRLLPGDIPVTVECVVVGVFRTGLDPLDKFTAFVPIQTARRLGGLGEGDPVANAVLLFGPDRQALAAEADAVPGLSAETADELAFEYLGSVLVIIRAAAFIGLALFFTVLLVWLIHETGVLVRVDGSVIASLRAIGVPDRTITWGYVALTGAGVAAGMVAAVCVASLLALVAPPITVRTGGLVADIAWSVQPLALVLVAAGGLLAATVAAWTTLRHVQAMNIRDGLLA